MTATIELNRAVLVHRHRLDQVERIGFANTPLRVWRHLVHSAFRPFFVFIDSRKR
jgi:hypothetical protein